MQFASQSSPLAYWQKFLPKNEIKNGKLKMKWFLGFFQLQEIRGEKKGTNNKIPIYGSST
jgi:hypothetical protein